MRRIVQVLALVAACVAALGVRAARADESNESKESKESNDGQPDLEEPRSRQGYWIGFGASSVAAQVYEDGKNRGVYAGYTGTFRIGQLITRRLGLGLLVEQIGAVAKGSDKGGIGGITLEASYLVWRDLSLHGGFGIGYIMAKNPNALDTSLRGGGGSYLLLGGSYDIFPFKKKLTGGWAVTPVVDLHLMPDGTMKFAALLAGVQLTWWSGLSDNMLRLPEE